MTKAIPLPIIQIIAPLVHRVTIQTIKPQALLVISFSSKTTNTKQMKFRIEKGSSKMLIFILTGTFLVILFSYQLFKYLKTNQFVYEFPGDWDKPLGIAVGLFLVLRSIKFVRESKELFIKISDNRLEFRTKRSDSIRKFTLSEIKNIKEKDEKIILVTDDSAKFVIVDFGKVRVKNNDIKAIKKALLELKIGANV